MCHCCFHQFYYNDGCPNVLKTATTNNMYKFSFSTGRANCTGVN